MPEDDFDLADLDQWTPDEALLTQMQAKDGPTLDSAELLRFGYAGEAAAGAWSP